MDREPLSFDDAQILRLESAAIKGHTVKLLVLAPGPGGERIDAAALRDRVAERIADFPRLRARVELPRRGRPWLVEEPDLDLDWHVRDGAAAPVDEVEFRRLTGELMSERLDHSRPLWALDVVPLEDGRSGLIARIHHALADGVTMIKTVSGMLWDPPPNEGPGRKSAPPRHPPHREPKPQTARGLLTIPARLRRELRPGRDTVLDRHIGSRRAVDWATFPIERLKRIEHGAGEGVTLNDVILAVIAGALRDWITTVGGKALDLRAQVPVALHSRRDDEKGIGNRDSFLNVDLPLSDPDPASRLRRINAETTEAKADHDPEALYAFFHALSRFRPLYRGVTRLTSGPREFALSVSNVPGPREPVSILGHALDEFCSAAEPADRHALRVSVISLGDGLAFGLCSDPDAIADLDHLAAGLERSVAELEAAV